MPATDGDEIKTLLISPLSIQKKVKSLTYIMQHRLSLPYPLPHHPPDSATHNRNCQQCRYPGSGVSKCVEDFQYRYVWAYCTHAVVTPDPHPHPQPKPKPVPHPIDHHHQKTDLFTPIEQFRKQTIISEVKSLLIYCFKSDSLVSNPYPL